jgi:mono/diheme cytochrome c family protein
MKRAAAILLAMASGIFFPARAAELSAQQIQAGQKLYLVKCAKCHELYDPGHYADGEWSAWMVKMGRKSKLKPEQFELLNGYLAKLRSEMVRTNRASVVDLKNSR